MKKTLLPLIAIACLIVGVVYVRTVSKQSPETARAASKQPPETARKLLATVAADVPIGPPVAFEVKYRGITGKKDDVRVQNFMGFGSFTYDNSSFAQAVKEKVQHKIHIISDNVYLPRRKIAIIEYTDAKILYVYFDLNADGQLNDNERLKPVDLPGINSGSKATSFLTPDFMITLRGGREVPGRVLLQVSLQGDKSNRMVSVIWAMMGLYEGVFTLNDQKLRFYLFSVFGSQGYTTFGQSYYSIVAASRARKGWLPRRKLSSLLVMNKKFYRVSFQASEGDSNKLIVGIAEDKSKRCKIAFKINGGEDFKHRLNNANLQGAKDKTINFTVMQGMNELPVGEYAVSSGYVRYGSTNSNDETYGYNTSFHNASGFTARSDKTTTIELGKPVVKVQAVESKKRYNSNKKYKTEFSKPAEIYIDASFVGISGETYRRFARQVKKKNYSTQEKLKAHIRIVDEQNNEIVSKDMEYG
jgi:hypothetical protein